MGKVFINNIEYPDILIERSNYFIKGSKEFAELSGKDTHITLDIDDNCIHTFIRHRGKGRNTNEFIVKMYIANPECVEITDDNLFRSPLFQDNFDKISDDDRDNVLSTYLDHDNVVGIDNIYREYFNLISKPVFERLKKYVSGQIVAYHMDRIYMKIVDEINSRRRYNNRIKVFWMYDILKYIDDNIYDKNSNIVKIEKDFIHEYKYSIWNTKYNIICNNSELKEALDRKQYTYIYITGKINIAIADYDIKPEDFVTWIIGAECYSLCYLFKDYPHEPHIHNWHVSNIKNIRSLFENSGVRDLSNMYFERCRYTRETFKNCKKLKKIPRFNPSKLKTDILLI